MNSAMHNGRARLAVTAILAGLGLWLGSAGSAWAADQWFDSGTAANIQPASGTTTGGLVWANSPAGSAMWASTSAGTTTPGLWTNSNNAYFTAAGTATVGVNGATATSVIFDSAGTWVFTNAGAPFTFADLTLKRGTVTVYSNALGSSSSTPVTLGAADQLALGTLRLDTVAAGDNTFSIGNLTAAGSSRLLLTNSVAGSTVILSGATLGRTGRGLLVVAPTNNATLGVTSKVLFTGGTNLTAGGILAPWLVAQAATGNSSLYDFLAYDPANGLTTNGVYQSGGWTSTKVVAGSGTLTVNTNAHALKLTGATTVNSGVTFTLGDGTYAGLLMDNTGGSANLIGAGTLSVGTAELIIHSPANALIGTLISGSGGLTLNGLGGDGAGKTLTISNMTYTGDTWINGGLTVAPGIGITQTYTNSIRGPGDFTKSGAGTLILADGNSSIAGGLRVTGGTLVFSGGTWTNAGVEDNIGTMIISNGAQVVGIASWNIGQQGGSANGGGVLTITNATLTTQSGGTFYVGNGNKSNTVDILAGGVLNAQNPSEFTVGRSAAGSFNVLNINGGTVTNGGAVGIGVGTSGGTGNSLVLGSGGKMYSGLVTIGNATGTNNTATVQNGGVLSSAGLTLSGTNNTATVQDGGVWNLGNAALTFNAGVPAPQSAVQTSGSGVFTNVGGITLSGGSQTFTASVASNFYLGTAGNITLGSAGNGGNTLTITGQTFTTSSDNTIGKGAGSNSNTVNVLAGTLWNGGGSPQITIGAANTTGNVLRVDGGGTSGGAVLTNIYMTAGLQGVGGQMIITNGGWVVKPSSSLNLAGISNQVVVVGNGVPGVVTKWDFGGAAGLSIAANANGNTLRVDGNGVYGGAIVTNAATTGAGAGSVGNVISVVNGGWLFMPFNDTTGGTNNHLNVGSAGMTSRWDCGSFWAAGNGCVGNIVTITNAIVFGGLQLGNPTTSGNASNGINVLANTLWNYNGVGLDMSYQNGGAQLGPVGNWYAVNGGIVSNVAGVRLAGTRSSLSISNNGQLLATSLAFATGATATNATVTLASGGLLEVGSGGLSVNTTGAGSTITNSGGIYQFTSATPTITTNGVAGGSIFLNNGTISFRGLANVNVKGNWSGADLARITFSGTNNAFRLNNSSGTNTYWFDAIAGAPTNYAGLELVNGNTAYTNGSVTIGTNGWLTFSNTTAIMWGAVTNYGQMRIHNSSVTFKTNLWVADGAKFAITGASNLPLVVNGTLTLPASAFVTFPTNAIGKNDTVTLFQSANPISYAGGGVGGWTVTGTHRLSVGTTNLVLRPRMPGFVLMVD